MVWGMICGVVAGIGGAGKGTLVDNDYIALARGKKWPETEDRPRP